MTVPIKTVTVSRYLGAGGEQIGWGVAEQLGAQYVDEQVIEIAAQRAGVSPEVTAQAEQRPTLVGRIMESFAIGGAGEVGLPMQQVGSRDYQEVIKQVVAEIGEQGGVVLTAHAAAHALGPRPDVLRLLVTASPDRQVATLVEHGYSQRDAERAVRESYSERADYLRRFYGVSEELPSQYDLCINTDYIDLGTAVQLVTTAVRSG